MPFSSQAVKDRARALGFNLVGITPAAPSPRLDAYQRWLEAGMHGEMGYLARPDRTARRRDLNVILPGVRALVVVGLDYHAFAVPPDVLNDPARGRFAAYAWGVDYHDRMAGRLEELAAMLGGARRVYVDTGAILERDHGQSAGLGFTGKNTLLIHPRRGSYFFLGEILTTDDADHYDTPGRATMCGTCNRCRAACPTDAFPAPYVLDARRCISYLTIEYKGWIPAELRPRIGNWVMGCDVCQDVCPFNRFAPKTGEPDFAPVDVKRAAMPLLDLLRLDDGQFEQIFAGSPVKRLKRDRLVRNACVAAGNWGHPDAAPPLVALLRDANPLVRGHAAWALGHIGDIAAAGPLHAALAAETDAQAAAEIGGALGRIG
ncbi:MAG: tRNA epoxyqueuosine(34) reductase QueG [Anaerolineae bacterium]|nr:tRNA epoxyqueuosine(34) reductase QueG [Anaerolineae bacterium]